MWRLYILGMVYDRAVRRRAESDRAATAKTPRRDGADRGNAGRGAGVIAGSFTARMCVCSCSCSRENANGTVELTAVDC